jgi:transcriptional regulator with XRE-family HTH domain
MAQKPQKWQLLDPPRTIGDHIRKRRLQLGWGATQLAALLDVSKDTVYNWEHGRSKPVIRHMPRIERFLGHSLTLPTSKGLGEMVKSYRISHGFSQRRLAQELGADPTTIGRIERNRGKPGKKVLAKIQAILEE